MCNDILSTGQMFPLASNIYQNYTLQYYLLVILSFFFSLCVVQSQTLSFKSIKYDKEDRRVSSLIPASFHCGDRLGGVMQKQSAGHCSVMSSISVGITV